MKRVAIICKKGKASHKIIRQVINFLVDRDCSVALSEGADWGSPAVSVLEEKEVIDGAELVLVLGGDGTLIHTSHLLNGRDIPVLGVNLGTLGFLTEIPLDEVEEALDKVLAGDFKVSKRRMLRATLKRDGNEVLSRPVLNDAVINKGALARILRVDAYTDGHQLLSAYRADGLIVSTPTGSTAYSMSAGGPVLFPTMNAFCITPICPHTFANRPVVLPDDLKVTIELVEANGEVYLSLDGQEGIEMLEGDCLEVWRAKLSISLISSPNVDFFHILRHKLGWGRT